ncbi:hypothetical protein SAMN05216388_1003106 [Halorientalis persicus]|uniref:Uncharacterized protein n=1 Tax=Halorientalis persicus TaxID=1367881 RepID=A0A1H8GHY5_9EURY|nr:hypothetical protein [Halorientalis persicus]SEN43636.1 hypothetical protein SAMN05216388_1003106 [Halorientalis persicus]
MSGRVGRTGSVVLERLSDNPLAVAGFVAALGAAVIVLAAASERSGAALTDPAQAAMVLAAVPDVAIAQPAYVAAFLVGVAATVYAR